MRLHPVLNLFFWDISINSTLQPFPWELTHVVNQATQYVVQTPNFFRIHTYVYIYTHISLSIESLCFFNYPSYIFTVTSLFEHHIQLSSIFRQLFESFCLFLPLGILCDSAILFDHPRLHPPPYHHHPLLDQPPFDTADMIPNQRKMEIPKNLSPNPIDSQDSSRSTTNDRPDGMDHTPTITWAQNLAVRTRTPPQAPMTLSPTPRLPPPSKGYTGYPGPQRVIRKEYIADSMGRKSPRPVYCDLPRHQPQQSPRVVDGCELARQEREMVLKLKASLPSEEARNREWQKRKAMRMKEIAQAQASRALRNRDR